MKVIEVDRNYASFIILRQSRILTYLKKEKKSISFQKCFNKIMYSIEITNLFLCCILNNNNQ